MSAEQYFKGWAIPGPVVPKSIYAELVPADDESLDALSGHYRVFQLKKGHRFSTDDLLVAAYGTAWCPCPRTVLDLGSGVGSVGMTAAWRLQGSRFVAVEAQEISVKLARRSCRLNGLEDRFEIREGDFREPKIFQKDEKFDLIFGSPPYFPLGTGLIGDHPQKISCRFEVRGSVSDYCRIASERVSWGGFVAIVFPMNPPSQFARVEQAARAANLAIVRRRPVILKEGDPPLLCLFGMMRTDHIPESFRNQTWEEPALTIRTRAGAAHPEYAALKLSVGLPPTY